MKDISKNHLLILIFSWLTMHFILFEYFGIRSLFDSTQFLNKGDFLIRYQRFEDVRQIFYAVFIFLIAVFRWLFPGQIIFFLVFQCVVSGIGMLALYRASTKIFNNQLAGFLTALIFLLWFDNIHWNMAIMTESLLCSFTCFIIFRLTFFKGTMKDYFWIIALSTIIFFIRPTGVLIILGVILFLINYYWPGLKNKPLWKASLIVSLFFIVIFGANVMLTYWNFSEQYEKGNIVTYMDAIKGSSLYSKSLQMEPSNLKLADDSELPLFKPLLFIFYNPVFFLKTGGLKTWYLVTAIRPYYSLLHNFYIIIWMGMVYFMYYFGCRSLSRKPIKTFTLTVILANCGLIAISSVDWDNRFYIPMEPGIVLLAGGGAAYFIKLISSFIRLKT